MEARSKPPLLEMRGIAKSFGNVRALNGVDMTIHAGEVVGLLGDNGAGKSTLIKILSGVYRPSSGVLLWNGTPIKLKSSSDAIQLGISTAYQDLAVIDQMSIWRNLFLGREHEIGQTFGILHNPFRLLRAAHAKRVCYQVLSDLGIEIRDVDADIASLSGGERQSIAIARAVLFESRLLILDEPTSNLSLVETEKVFGYVRRARDVGIGVVIITHNVHNAISVADSYLILHQGTVAWRAAKSEASFDQLNLAITTGMPPGS